MAFLTFLRDGRLVTKAELPLCDSGRQPRCNMRLIHLYIFTPTHTQKHVLTCTEEYLGAVLDFTGELNRFAVAGTSSNFKLSG